MEGNRHSGSPSVLFTVLPAPRGGMFPHGAEVADALQRPDGSRVAIRQPILGGVIVAASASGNARPGNGRREEHPPPVATQRTANRQARPRAGLQADNGRNISNAP